MIAIDVRRFHVCFADTPLGGGRGCAGSRPLSVSGMRCLHVAHYLLPFSRSQNQVSRNRNKGYSQFQKVGYDGYMHEHKKQDTSCEVHVDQSLSERVKKTS